MATTVQVSPNTIIHREYSTWTCFFLLATSIHSLAVHAFIRYASLEFFSKMPLEIDQKQGP